MGRSFEELWAEMTGKQQNAFHMKVWAALGGRETGEEGMKRLMSGEARLVLEYVVKSEWQRLLEACHQSHVDSDFTEDHWPLEPIADDEDEWEVVKHRLANTVTGAEGLRQLEKLAAKGEIRLLTGLRRAMDYISTHLDIQPYHPVILPLRAQNHVSYWRLPVFSGFWCNGYQRNLRLERAGITFHMYCDWLVLKRKQK